ncbi:unnamed protein product, partial [Ilex paraguariensis]
NASSSGDNSMTSPHDSRLPIDSIITSNPSEFNSMTTPYESKPTVNPIISPDPPESSSTLDVHCSNRVRAPPIYLSNYHYFSTLATLHEPHNYREAFLTLFGSKLCLKNLMPFTKLILGIWLICLLERQ